MTVPGDAVSPKSSQPHYLESGVSLIKRLKDQVLELRCEPVEGQGAQAWGPEAGRVELPGK